MQCNAAEPDFSPVIIHHIFLIKEIIYNLAIRPKQHRQISYKVIGWTVQCLNPIREKRFLSYSTMPRA